MRLVLMHVHDAPSQRPDEEAMFIVPGGAKIATAMPFFALDRVISIFDEALGELPQQTCEQCGGALAAAPVGDRP